MTTYSDTITSSASTDLTTTRTMSAIAYNNKGQMSSYQDVSIEKSLDPTKLDVTTTTLRNSILYNALGQMTTYADTITSSASADLTTTRTMSAVTYNNKGQMSSYQDVSIEKNSDPAKLDVTTT